MASRFWSWLFADKPAAASMVRTGPVRAPAAEPVPGPAPPGPDPAERAPERTAEALRSVLATTLARDVAAIRAGLAPADIEGDAALLLDSLTGDLDRSIRRPPLAAQQALTACRDPNVALSVILDAFHQDPVLTQSLLKHANSPFYATGGSVSSLADAAHRVGLSGLHSVLMSSIVEGLLCRPGGEYATMVHQVWTHMVRTAPAARRIGRALGLPAETSYTLGLLHDLGKLVIFDRITTIRRASRHSLRLPRPFLRETLSRLHGPLGGLVALAWSLDIDSARAIAGHPRGELRYRGDVMSQVLAVAEWWDLTTVREQRRDYDALWARAGLTVPRDLCRAALDDR